MVKNILFTAATFCFLFLSACQAFLTSQGAYFQGTTSMLNLHPDQAEELVECAQDFMRQSLEEKEEAAKLLSIDISQKLKVGTVAVHGCDDRKELSSTGPMSWVRSRLWLFRPRQCGSPRDVGTASIASKKLP
ncbi:hypothetical protein IV203_019278 [Nitzschia inconspicua]|uniref:Uncharacterized protein n=1 Tax=Nitzschia inconspicua TaxID=303405 RepID=A0A9K3Q4C6_9STRA|nr:hypothetical protein IV203_019278 [Nitzschia inconspicua]